MSDQFINPVTTTFALLEKYKGLVRHNLEKQGLSAEEVDHVVKSLALDQKLYFTINRSYQPGQQSFRQFFTKSADCTNTRKRRSGRFWMTGQPWYRREPDRARPKPS